MAIKSAKLHGGDCSPTRCSINDLDDSLLTEVLQRLPTTREVTACKFVSKQWYFLISSTHFAYSFVTHHEKYFSKEPKPFASIFNHWKKIEETQFRLVHHITSKERLFTSSGFQLKFLPCYRPGHPDDTLVLASYNDLLLCCSLRVDYKVYYLCNPLTSQWVALPPFPGTSLWATVGFVCDNHRFRVMRLPHDPSTSEWTESFTVEMFCSETNLWNEMVVVSPKRFLLGHDMNVFSLNSMMHWFAKDNRVVAYNPYQPERCYLIDMPPETVPPRAQGRVLNRLGSYQGCLHFLRLTPPGVDCSVRIWELANYDSAEWILTHKVSLTPLLRERMDYDECDDIQSIKLEALTLDPNDQNTVYLAFETSVYSYNLQTKELQSIHDTQLNVTVFGAKWDSYNVLQLILPWWPTKIPALPQNP